MMILPLIDHFAILLAKVNVINQKKLKLCHVVLSVNTDVKNFKNNFFQAPTSETDRIVYNLWFSIWIYGSVYFIGSMDFS